MTKLFTLFFGISSFFFANSQVVISQIYGGGGIAGSQFRNDYVELYNTGNADVYLTGYSVQYTSATGSFNSNDLVPLSGRVPAHEHYLVQFGSGGANGANLPTPDAATNSINISATAGKIALVSNTNPLTSCPAVPVATPVIDFIGYGTTANCSLGANAMESSNTSALHRKNGGNTNTQNNLADFETGDPAPHNSGLVLPVKLISFTASAQGNSILFNWKTATEHNSRHFEIEQSTDGRSFSPLVIVAAAGTSISEKSYSYTGVLNASTTYYRLKSVDIDGRFTTSAIIKITPSKTGLSLGNVYPVPAKNTVTVEWNSNRTGATSIQLSDINGRTLRTLSVNAVQGFNKQVINVEPLAAGMYYIQLLSQSGKLQTIVIKQ